MISEIRNDRLVRWSVLAAASGLLIASATMNARYGASLGQDEIGKLVWVVASVASDVCKALAPVVLVAAVYRRDWFRTGATLVLIAVTVVYSATAAIGFTSSSRSQLSSKRSTQMMAYDDARAIQARALAEMNRIGGHPRWRSTSACSDATVSKSIAFCAVNLKIYERAAADLAKVRSVLGQGRPEQKDPQAQTIAEFAGAKVERVQVWLSWLAAALVEIGSLVGFVVGTVTVRRETLAVGKVKPVKKLDRQQALRWLMSKRQVEMSNRELGKAWGVSHGTAGRWVNEFVDQRHVRIRMVGRKRQIVVQGKLELAVAVSSSEKP